MTSAADLEAALAAKEIVAAQAKKLAEKLAELEAKDLALCDQLAEARAALDHQLGLSAIGDECDVQSASARHHELSESSRGVDAGIGIIKAKIAVAAGQYASAETHVDAVMAALAAPLVDGARADMLENCERFAASFKLLMQLDHLARFRQGFRTGTAALTFAGSPDEVLARSQIYTDSIPALRERVHDLRPAEMLALLEETK